MSRARVRACARPACREERAGAAQEVGTGEAALFGLMPYVVLFD
jgi:hypothetical protein